MFEKIVIAGAGDRLITRSAAAESGWCHFIAEATYV
jgi:hypothetical protein